MNLPNYFLADLPVGASLSPEMIAEACQTLKRNREQYLLGRSTTSLVRSVSDLAGAWLDPDYVFRKLALRADPKETGFAPATLASGLDQFFGQLTEENLYSLLELELGRPSRLDELCATPADEKCRREALGRGPEFLVHIAAGNIPNPIFLSMLFGLLLRSAQFVKCASGAAYLPRLLAHSLYEREPKLASCLELAEWPGGQESLESALFREADCVTATGNDETLATIRHRIPIQVRLLGYGHRVSFGYVAAETLSGQQSLKVASRAVKDVVAWNQLGCLSPHLFYIESGGRISPERFAEMLAAELAKSEEEEPRGAVTDSAAAAIAHRRAFYEVRSSHSPDTRQWCSPQSTAWTVVFEADPRFQLSCLHRFIYVKAVKDLTEALQGADSVRGRVSTVGLAAGDTRSRELATGLARWGVTRICSLGQMQQPPLTWRHDGRPALGDLITWTDWEVTD